jgi:hypothetical protein
MKRLLAALAFSAMALSAGAALACSCVRYASAAEHAAEADVIFVGRVVSTEAVTDMRQATTFEVSETLKGETSARRVVMHGGAAMAGSACGIVYRVGQEALVIAHRGEDGVLGTSSCSAPRWEVGAYRDALSHDHH